MKKFDWTTTFEITTGVLIGLQASKAVDKVLSTIGTAMSKKAEEAKTAEAEKK